MKQSNPSSDPAASHTKGGELLARTVSDYIEFHFREKFSLQTMAKTLYVNGSYLLRVFKKHTGYTPLAYHNHIRCERAKDLLIHSDRSVSDIGEAVGFVSSAHFSHVFKKEEGCTPSEYRGNKMDSRMPESTGSSSARATDSLSPAP